MSRKKRKEPNFIWDFLQTLLQYGVTVYMGLLIVVLPFYYEQGYGYIATDKATFFCKTGVNMWKVLLPLAILYAIASIAVNHAKILQFCQKKPLKNVIKDLFCKIPAVDFFVVIYGVAVVLSYLCSGYREDALWGAKGWYMGLWPQLMLVCLYFLVAKCRKPAKWMFYLMLPVSAVVFGLGYLNRFGVYPIKMEYASGGYISTIGNINWYCSYVVPILFAMIGLWWQGRLEVKTPAYLVKKIGADWEKRFPKMVYAAYEGYIFLGFATLMTQGSASGVFALGVMMIILFCLSAGEEERMLRFWKLALLLSAACMLTLVVRGIFPKAITFRDGLFDLFTASFLPILMTAVSYIGIRATFWSIREKKYDKEKIRKVAMLCVTLVSCIGVVYVLILTVNSVLPRSMRVFSEISAFTFSNEWGSNRGATWKAGWMCFAEQDFLHKLVGVGPDAMWSYISMDGSEALKWLVEENFEGRRLTNAHNEWLTVLVDYGIFGLVSFVGMIMTAVRSFGECLWRELLGRKNTKMRKQNKSTGQERIPAACALGVVALTINNIFSFQQVVNMTVLFLLLGMGSALSEASS